MPKPGDIKSNNGNDNKIRHLQILDIGRIEYGDVSPLLSTLLSDIDNLYHGEWDGYEACQTGYHNLSHATDVALITAQMIAGWNHIDDEGHPKISEELFLIAMAAAMFHDAGYIKKKGDPRGTGGKFSFIHEDRGIVMAAAYLKNHQWPEHASILAANIISTTKFYRPLEIEGLFTTRDEEAVGCMVATADLIAQMADVNYMQRINELYAELQEAYKFEGKANLRRRGYKIFSSPGEMIAGTVDFYENLVLPRLQKLGRMDQYLLSFFGTGRNPYMESIMANLSSQLIGKHSCWRRLGDILKDLGVVTKEDIASALQIQQKYRSGQSHAEKTAGLSPRERLLQWMEGSRFNEDCIGELLIDMEIINPTMLRHGLLQQIMPSSLVDGFSRSELLYFLEISVLLQNIASGPWIFNQILEMTNGLLKCEASCILLSKAERQEMGIAISTGIDINRLDGRIVPTDKGLAGWVYSHGTPAIVSNVYQDERVDSEIDNLMRQGSDFRSILAVPLHINGEPIGVMEFFNKQSGEFSGHDMDILTMLTNLVAVSLDNAFRLQEHYQKLQ
ncbi:MAG: GAF domain-containing protein [Desulfobulbaceae bacterium]|nr:GAF domain-containing protein [Desulfobulbaceae bacterium]